VKTKKELLEAIRGTAERLAKAVRDARADIAAVEARGELTREAKSQAVEARRDELREEAHAIESTGKEALDSLKAAAPEAPSVDPMEAMRIWARHERVLEGGMDDPGSLTERLAREGDRIGLIVLMQELPSYMQGKGEDRRLIDATLTAARKLEGSILEGREAEHRQAVAAAEDAAHRLQINAGTVLFDLETTELLVGATTAQDIDLTEES
jgi:hypothetical protein